MLTRRQFLSLSSALCAVAPASLIEGLAAESPASPPAPPKIGASKNPIDISSLQPRQFKLRSDRTCRILQFTDYHFFAKTSADDAKTLADCAKQVELHHPDLVVISGDLWHDNPEGRGQKGLEMAVKAFSSWSVPWTTCWGNHDLLDDYDRGHETLASSDGSVYGGARTHGDYRLEAVAASGAVVIDIYFLNSNTEGLGLWQINALAKLTEVAGQGRAKAIPALGFFHMPLLDYETRVAARSFKGIKLEGVGAGKEKGAAYPVITRPGTIRACFCGHNHTNDYAITTGAVDLVYGRSTGYAGYGGEKVRKGAKLIELDLNTGKYEQTTVFADGTKNVA